MVVMTEMPHDHKPSGFRPHKDPSWPSLGAGDANLPAGNTSSPDTGGDDWGEFQDMDGGSEDEAPKIPLKGNPKILHRCASTPDFGFNDQYSDSGSSAGPEDGEGGRKGDVAEPPTPAVVSPPGSPSAPAKPAGGSVWGAAPAKGDGVPRPPSFADMVKLNADASAEDEAKRAAHIEAMAEKMKREREARRKARARHMKLVVTPIKRCSKSTGDLQNLSKISEADHHEDDFGGGCGGGGGGGFGGIAEHHEEEVLGATDAMEFYHRKAKGVQNRVSGKMIRPDEAKRKEMSVHKREAQRQKQQAAQGGKGGGSGKTGKGGGSGKTSGAEKHAGKGGKGKSGKKR